MYTRRRFLTLSTTALACAACGLSACSNGGASQQSTSSTQALQAQSTSLQQASASSASASSVPSSLSAAENTSTSSATTAVVDAQAFAIADKHLASGYTMPAFGIGTWTLSSAEAEAVCYCALEQGYRLIDTAQYYGNEEGVGAAVRRGIADGLIDRETVFVTSKIMPSSYERAAESIEGSRARLDIDYIDLMLIHQPGSHDEVVWRALEDTGGFVESWYPLGGRPGVTEVLGDATIGSIAASHGKTPAQIVLRWHVQSGYIAIPGSSNPDHIAENIQIFDFQLTNKEMEALAALHGRGRFENW